MSDTKVPTVQDADTLLREFTKDERLIYHAYAVAGVLRYMARKAGEDETRWFVIGLIHDLDWEMFPAEHCRKTRELLTARGWPEEYIRAAVSHGWGICSDVEPLSRMEKMLYALDELTGLVAATALVRPSRSVLEVETKSVLKKWKTKGFAAGANRDLIQKGADMLGIPLEALITDCIAGMREVADQIGLRGNPGAA
ncbi:MAG: hydrolase [Lentisphaerae bacterium RIFOXYB12_FULL_65_16]|nr:MAG: hydrolase [Lentisphaerae bacterium RIFOXYA12_64_32]OGV84489.1 MAG: hydrolase [Lentisphaerae bacterium RIFOXYB12_FULL_65_16]